MNNHDLKFTKKEKWEVCEVICLKCLHRWIACFPQEVLLMVGWESVDMVDVYNDTSTDEMLREYFDISNKN